MTCWRDQMERGSKYKLKYSDGGKTRSTKGVFVGTNGHYLVFGKGPDTDEELWVLEADVIEVGKA